MSTSILISVLGAFTAIVVSITGAWFANRNSIILQTRKLKEEHYVAYIEALHNLGIESSNRLFLDRYASARDKMLLIASDEVVRNMIIFETEVIGRQGVISEVFLTNLIKSIRRDLRIRDKNFPDVQFKA